MTDFVLRVFAEGRQNWEEMAGRQAGRQDAMSVQLWKEN